MHCSVEIMVFSIYKNRKVMMKPKFLKTVMKRLVLSSRLMYLTILL